MIQPGKLILTVLALGLLQAAFAQGPVSSADSLPANIRHSMTEGQLRNDQGNRSGRAESSVNADYEPKRATPLRWRTLRSPGTDTILQWQASRKLTWDDYLSEPEPGATAAASTATWLGMEYHRVNNELTFKVICSFSMKHSWGVHRTEYILAHEQGHFDIAEFCARLLHQRLLDYRFNANTYKDDLHRMYAEVSKEKDRLQEQYDQETNHSINREQQQLWLRRINVMLRESAAYSDYR